MARSFSILLLAFSLNLLPLDDRHIFAADEVHNLDIQIEGKGIATVTARLDFPAPREVVFAVLTDYANWPILFPDGIEMNVERHSSRTVIIDMKIPHKVASWKSRLKAKWTETPPNKLETTLVEGDFLRYEQVWQLIPIQGGRYTRAELSLTLQPKGWMMKWVPEFLYRWSLREDLEEHFEKFRRRVQMKNGAQFKKAR